MIHHKLFMATAIMISVSTACSDTTAPNTLVSEGALSEASPRSGDLNVTKECSLYFGHKDEFCTVTSSNLKHIPVGSRVVYASDAVGASLDTDIVLDPPGRGNTRAFGHCTLSLATGVGVCRLSGGTGKLKGIRARVAVSYLGGPNFAWDGSYSLRNRDRDDDD